MTVITGTLVYGGVWKGAWNVTDERGTSRDISRDVDKYLRSHNGLGMVMVPTATSVRFARDPEAGHVLEYQRDETVVKAVLRQPQDGFGTQVITSFLEDALQHFSGRRVIFEVSGDALELRVDEGEAVHHVERTNGSSACSLSEPIPTTVCRVGTKERCIFLRPDPGGFVCEKFGSLGTALLRQHAAGSLKATRVGNCGIVV